MKEPFVKGKYSKRHHYIPVFFLKGFADDEGLIYIYDKVKDSILLKQKPESKFYEKDLNNYKTRDGILLTIEEPYYTPLDTRLSPIFSKIQSGDINQTLTALEKFEVLYFINHLFWRSPQSNKLFIELVNKEGLSNKYFGFKNENGEKVDDNQIPEIKTQVLQDVEIQKMFKQMIALSDGSFEESKRLFDKWYVITLTNEESSFLVGDYPFLINNSNISMNNVFDEMIFPLSKNKLLILSDKSPNFLDGILFTNINSCVIAQSKRFVASSNEKQLKNAIEHYKASIESNTEQKIIEDTFKFMYHLSEYKDHDEYIKAVF
ncbi:DUF4238 domain-containing protein [Flavobacterium sp. LT1R49]|uniref:DUF4238 domain-containing protein n=1 Tax=Flavobacterium arabinosi TaxID=3398737 RepID=UPI003A8A7B53